MPEQKIIPTIFQKLTRLFGTGGQPVINKQPSMPARELLTATSAEELMLKKLEAQQAQYLGNQFEKITSNLYQQSVYYETTRMASYSDFMAMEYTPEISATLDLASEECCTKNEFGKMLQIFSDSKRVKTVLENLFYNALDIDVNLPAWTRNTLKFGDNFLYLKSEIGKGIVGVKQLPNIEIRREESSITDQKNMIRFIWQGKSMEFTAWQIAHFRLLGDDTKLPYGVSFLEKVRKIWKQLILCLAKDTKIWTENGYKEIQDIKEGETVYSFDCKTNKLVKSKVKKCWKTSDSREIYKIRTRYNEIKVTNNHPILVTDGKTITYKNINQIDLKKDRIFSPSVNEGVGNIKIKLNPDEYYIRLNNKGKEYAKTINRNGIIKKLKKIDEKNYKNVHEFIQGNRTTKYNYLNDLNKEIGITENMVDVSMNKTKSESLVNNNLEYETDKGFFRFFGFMLGDGWINYNKTGVGFALGEYEEQNEYYINYIKNKFNKNYSETKEIKGKRGGMINIYSKELVEIFKNMEFISGFDKKIIPDWAFTLNKECRMEFIRGLFDADGSDRWGVLGLSNKKLITKYKELCQQTGIGCGKISEIKGSIKEENGKLVNRKDTYKLYVNWNNIKDVRTEKIISIEKQKETEEVWDLEVDSDLHNFVANGIVVHNSEDAMLTYRITRAPERRVFNISVGNLDDKDVESYIQKVAQKFKRQPQAENTGNFTGQVDMRFQTLSVDQDFFLPQRAGGEKNTIETLPGAQNLDQIHDIEYIQRKLFTAMRVPKAFLGFEEAIGEGKNLALQDIRFARTINRIQQSMIQELNKIAIIHLYMLGFEEEIDNFTLTLNSPSTQAEMLKIEQWKEKVLLYKDLVSINDSGFPAVSMVWAKKNILGFSNDEIMLDLNQQRIEKAAAAENEAPQQVIHTGIFDALDKRYQQKPGEETPESTEGEEGAPGSLPGVGSPGGEEELPMGGPEGGPAGGGEMPALPELTEDKIQILENEDKEQDSKYKILDDNNKVLHEDIKNMLSDIDQVLSSGKKIEVKKIENKKED